MDPVREGDKLRLGLDFGSILERSERFSHLLLGPMVNVLNLVKAPLGRPAASDYEEMFLAARCDHAKTFRTDLRFVFPWMAEVWERP